MASHRFEPELFRSHVLEAMSTLPSSEHLRALRAIDRGDVEVDITEDTVRVVLGDVCEMAFPLRDVG